MESRDIGWVVRGLKDGKRFRRAGWNGKGMHLEFVTAENAFPSTLAYVMMRTAKGEFVPWLCSQTDLLAEDWEEVDRDGRTVK